MRGSETCEYESSPSADEEDGDPEDDQMSKFMARSLRSMLPCCADSNALKPLLLKLDEGRQKVLQICVSDTLLECKFCHRKISDESLDAAFASSLREVTLHTLSHGSMKISVTDYIFLYCSEVKLFDGVDSSLFAATSRSVFCRDILDFWVYHVVALGGTFREAYQLSKQVSKSPGMGLFRIGGELTTRRRSSSTCFAGFLRTLTVPKGAKTATLFTCSKCEDADGRLSAIVMDGTATGILGKLPNFDRPSTVIPSCRGPSVSQFILSRAKVRRFLESFCSSARRPTSDGTFDVLKGKRSNADWKAAEDLFKGVGVVQEYKALVVSQFLLSAFSVIGGNTLNSVGEAGVEHDLNSAQGAPHPVDSSETDPAQVHSINKGTVSFKFRHLLPTIDIRNQIVDFIRCFMTSSVPATLLRSSDISATADKLSHDLIAFAGCERAENVGNTALATYPCTHCCEMLA